MNYNFTLISSHKVLWLKACYLGQGLGIFQPHESSFFPILKVQMHRKKLLITNKVCESYHLQKSFVTLAKNGLGENKPLFLNK